MKKIGLMLIGVVLVSLPLMAQENLKYYLDAIAELNSQEIEADNDYRTLYQNTVNQLKTDSQMELSRISNLEKFPWENTDEFMDRIKEESDAVIQKRDMEMDNFRNEYSAMHNEKISELEGKKTELAEQMLKKEFCYKGTSVKTTFGKFDADNKVFPLSVKCLEKELPYINSSLQYEIDRTNIADAYLEAEKAINNDEISAEVYFQVLKKNFTDEYQKKVTHITLRSKNNAVLKDYSINEVVDTFSIKQVINEDSSIISDEE